MKRAFHIVAAAAFLAAARPAPAAESPAPEGDTGTVHLIRIAGAIGPATASYISRAVDIAAAQHADCLVIELDTPGGLLESTKQIVMVLLASRVPSVVYVTPAGATAGSAGCFITLAADVAAMAPATTIGAAHPVQMGGGGEEKTDDTMKQKLESYAASYIEAIAVKRDRNVEWARSAVTSSASITGEIALETGVIEILATDLPDLLRQLDGRKVAGRALRTAGATIVQTPLSLRERVFQAVWRPEVMFILMLIAMYGIIGELSNPGATLPGVAGAIAVVLLLYMASVIPLNVAGVALIVLSAVMFIIETMTPTYGVLTAGGIISFLLGSLMLFDRLDPVYRLSLAYVVPAAAVTALFFLFVAGAGLRAQLRPARTGKEAMVGMVSQALTRVDEASGKIFVEGEYWNAVSETPIEAGRPVEIVAVRGLTARVRPVAAPAAAKPQEENRREGLS